MVHKIMKNKFLVYDDNRCKIKDFYNETILKLKPYDFRYLSVKDKISKITNFDVEFKNDKINVFVLKQYFKYVISSNYKNDEIIFFLYKDKIILAKENLKIILVFNMFKNVIGNNFVKLDDSIFYYGNDYNLNYIEKNGYLYLKNDELISKMKIISNNSKLETIKNITLLDNKPYKNVIYKKTSEETVFFGDKDYYVNGFNNVIPEGANMKLYEHLPFVVYETPDYTAFFSR